MSEAEILAFSTTFLKEAAKTRIYHDSKNFSFEKCKSEATSKLSSQKSYECSRFERCFTDALDKQSSKKQKVFHGNQKLDINKALTKGIMKRPQIKSRANKTKSWKLKIEISK